MSRSSDLYSFRQSYIDEYKPKIKSAHSVMHSVRVASHDEIKDRTNDADREKSSERIATLHGLDHKKHVFVPKKTSIERLHDLGKANDDLAEICDELADYVDFCAAVSAKNFSFEPVLLLGEPGVGKTYFADQLTEALGLINYKLSVSEASESFYLSGSQRGYANSMPGRIADRMSKSVFANPIIVLDELDKAPFERNDRPGMLAPLLQLLERDSAKTFRDLSLDLEIDCSRINYICTANSTESIPKALLNRLRVVEVNRPSPEQMVKIASNIFSNSMNELCGFNMPRDFFFDNDASEIVSEMTPRDVRMVARKVITKLVCKNPDSLTYIVGEEFFDRKRESRKKFIGFVDTNLNV